MMEMVSVVNVDLGTLSCGLEERIEMIGTGNLWEKLQRVYLLGTSRILRNLDIDITENKILLGT